MWESNLEAFFELCRSSNLKSNIVPPHGFQSGNLSIQKLFMRMREKKIDRQLSGQKFIQFLSEVRSAPLAEIRRPSNLEPHRAKPKPEMASSGLRS